MQNLYTAKNPFMSLWLSAANTYMNTAKGLWTAEMQKQQHEMTKQMFDLSMRIWFPWLNTPKK